ncbi:podocan isoform X1 [Dasypus novemcinctus]|uniref:podocan isoform X1 n=1 Tax=Dasypus novemcinctus TaxID=9361 RepID=UPI00265FA63D|nr:podocan isoform X1 [Dasypus novemcinctus]XP_058159554.1 podocan isoform X1 [Dasypus novemcinctus]
MHAGGGRGGGGGPGEAGRRKPTTKLASRSSRLVLNGRSPRPPSAAETQESAFGPRGAAPRGVAADGETEAQSGAEISPREVLAGTMARSRALLLLLLLPQQLGRVLAARASAFGRAGAHSLSPEENEFGEGPVLVLSPEEPVPGPATIDCPRDCACSQEGVVDCGGIDLREFPGDLPEHTNHLSLQNNQLEKIYPGELSRLHRLETLNLQNNRLTSRGLPEEAFEHLTTLNYLYLANNKLTLAPRILPNTLISVDFAANYLTKIYGLTFGQKPNLRSVYLHNNKLADAGLPDNMFNGSSNVEILILSSNFLRHVPKHLPPALYKLHLKNNKLEKIPPGAFNELSNLRELYLQNNYLTDEGLDNETFWKLSSLEYLDLSSNNLSRVPAGLPRSLVLLHLEKNAIRSVDADVLTPIRSLEYLLLHSNQLRARGIHPLAFQGLKRLHTVHLYNNALERVPSGLPRRVRTLMILHNDISGIGRDDFATTYFLEELNLSYNRITSPQVHRDAFRKLRLLRSLDLSGNRLHTLPPGLPRNVHVLKVKRNELAALARGALAGMAQLRELYLTGNRLRSKALGPRAWADLPRLQLLDVAENQLTEIPEGLPESLEYLYLQNNKISTVPANAFAATPNLKGIFLRFNKLAVGSVMESTFRKLKHLQVLDIEGTFEFGDVSKGHRHLEEEEEEDEEEEDEEEEEAR